jgi:hypothetical protein
MHATLPTESSNFDGWSSVGGNEMEAWEMMVVEVMEPLSSSTKAFLGLLGQK